MTVYNYLWNSNLTYYSRIVDLLDFRNDYDFVFISKTHDYNYPRTINIWPELKKELIHKQRPVIIFLADDEYRTLGDEYIIPGITKKIFKQYTNIEFKDHPVIRPVPLPNSPTVAQQQPFINWNSRMYDYSFMGVIGSHRLPLKQSLQSRVNDNCNKFVFFYEEGSNNRPLTSKQYTNVLSNSKLTLCPPGWRCNESFRIVECARFGCIILAAELIPLWYNVPSPYIQIKDWSDLSVIDNLLAKSERELKDISYETRKWYDDYLSPEAVAKYVTKEVLS
jgi:hypothetical protein